MKSIITIISLQIFFISCAIKSGHATKSSQEIIPYYAGKNEICLSDKKSEYNGVIIRIVEITDVYSTTDKETYCTIIFKSKFTGKKSFSASKARCDKLKSRAGYEDTIVDIVGNHICGV